MILPCLNEPYLAILKQELTDYEVDVRTEKGLSFAVWKGIQESKRDIVVIMDADGSHNPIYIKRMLRLLNEETWLVVGSRYCKGGYSYDVFFRKIISRFYCVVAQIVLRTKIRDSMSGFWVGYKKVFNFTPSNTYKFGIELVRKYKNYIKECPIIFHKRQNGKSHVKPMQALQDFIAVFRSFNQ